MAVCVVRRSITVRLAKPTEGPLLHQLAVASEKWEIEGLDWNFSPTPYWLIAEYDGKAVGCMQVCPGVPIARIEFLCVPTSLPRMLKARVVKAIVLQGVATCKELKAQFVTGIIHDGMEGFGRVMARRGGYKWFRGDCYLFPTKVAKYENLS